MVERIRRSGIAHGLIEAEIVIAGEVFHRMAKERVYGIVEEQYRFFFRYSGHGSRKINRSHRKLLNCKKYIAKHDCTDRQTNKLLFLYRLINKQTRHY